MAETPRITRSITRSITYMPDDDKVVLTVARWHHETWGSITGRSVEIRAEEMNSHRESRSIPLTRVGWVDGTPVGTAALDAHDMSTHMVLTPWLASVYVEPEYRRRGIGEQLCRAVVEDAHRLGVETLYLFTPDKMDYYAAMGWRALFRESYRGEDVTVMELGLKDVKDGV